MVKPDLEERRGEPTEMKVLVREVMTRIADGLVEEEVDEAEKAQKEREECEQSTMRFLMARGVPKKAARVIATNALQETDFLRRVKDFMQGPPGTLVLSGGVGCGKTVAASWAVLKKPTEECVGGRKWPVEYYPTFLDVTALSRMPMYGEAAREALDPVENCWVLVIDDLGNEVADTRKVIAGLIDAIVVKRHDNELRTIMTTNMGAETFVKRFGDRVKDRIRGSGAFFCLESPSRR